jgi:DNA mismatch repair protein MutS
MSRLAVLAAKLQALACHSMRVKEWQDDVVCLAKVAGLPKSVTARAEEVLSILEKGEQGGALARLADHLPLFSAPRRRADPMPRANPPWRPYCATPVQTS